MLSRLCLAHSGPDSPLSCLHAMSRQMATVSMARCGERVESMPKLQLLSRIWQGLSSPSPRRRIADPGLMTWLVNPRVRRSPTTVMRDGTAPMASCAHIPSSVRPRFLVAASAPTAEDQAPPLLPERQMRMLGRGAAFLLLTTPSTRVVRDSWQYH